MEWLNYHHLFYFYTVAHEGGVTRAADRLLLAQSTLSAQIRALEESLGVKLFEKSGRRLVLTEAGQTAMRYAEEIFGLGREMTDELKGRASTRPIRLMVGVVDSLPKLAVFRLLEPALRVDPSLRLVVLEGKMEPLLADLSINRLDLVLSDAPVAPYLKIKAFNHLLGECGVSFFATPVEAQRLRRGFPRSLNGARMILPLPNTALRRSLEQWFAQNDVQPNVVAETEDSALAKVFGQVGLGVFAAPCVLEDEINRQYHVRLIGRTEEVRERFYAISTERKVRHPAVRVLVGKASGK